jgi:signal transduction histidine kinase
LEQQSDFIAVTAHEFRTPLSIAMFQLEDTLTTHEHTPQVVKDMEVMSESLNNLRNLTQTLFDVQQYDLNKIKLNKSKVDIREYLNQIVQEFKFIIEEKNINFHYKNNIKEQSHIEIDEQQIRQVFANLFNNAIKFADNDNPEISIEINENENTVQIAIIDNGSGVQDKDKKRVFEKFQTTKVSMGTGIGLGLYICKKIIELHKCKIWIEDNKPKGTTFIFELRK